MPFWYTDLTPPPPPSLLGTTTEDTLAIILVLFLSCVLVWRIYILVSTLSAEMCRSAIYIVIIPVLIHLLLMYGLPLSNLGALRERWLGLLGAFNSTMQSLSTAAPRAMPSTENYLIKTVEYYWNRR